MQNLQDVLANKKRILEEKSPEREKNKKEWIERVNNLFELIHNWLEPLQKNDYLRISYADIRITEELIGQYNSKKMIITFFNNEKIELEPIGLHIIGAKGRVDMRIGIRTIMIVGNNDDSGWMFSEREGREKPRRWDFKKEEFEKILSEFAEEEF